MNAFQGRTGKISMMRVLTAFVVVTCMAVWVAANIVCWFRGCAMTPMDVQTVALIVGVMGTKAAQVFAEIKTTKDIPTDLKQ